VARGSTRRTCKPGSARLRKKLGQRFHEGGKGELEWLAKKAVRVEKDAGGSVKKKGKIISQDKYIQKGNGQP